MEWNTMNKITAREVTERWNNLLPNDFMQEMTNWKDTIISTLNVDYRKLRNKVNEIFDNVVSSLPSNDSYKYSFDLEFALQFYKIMSSLGFSIRQASIDGIWRDLCVRIFPDIVIKRFPPITNEDGKTKNVREERFWNSSRRIYLKTLWWYIHLSLQPGEGDIDELIERTREALKYNGADTVVQLVERAGTNGYRTDLYRLIMKEYAKYNGNMYLFRKVMVYNTARCVVVEPALTDGGLKEYVKDLFDYCK